MSELRGMDAIHALLAREYQKQLRQRPWTVRTRRSIAAWFYGIGDWIRR